MCCQDRTSASSGALQMSAENSLRTRAAKNSDGQGPEVCPSRKAAGHFQTVTNSDLRLQTSDSEHEHKQEQERCVRASSFLRHSSFVLRHSSVLYCCVRAAENSHRQGPEVCPSRQARDFEAVTGLTMQLF